MGSPRVGGSPETCELLAILGHARRDVRGQAPVEVSRAAPRHCALYFGLCTAHISRRSFDLAPDQALHSCTAARMSQHNSAGQCPVQR